MTDMQTDTPAAINKRYGCQLLVLSVHLKLIWFLRRTWSNIHNTAHTVNFMTQLCESQTNLQTKKQNTPFESRIPALLFNPTRIRFKLPAQPWGGWVLLCDLYASDIQIRSVINSYLCHLSLNAVALEGSHGFLSCSRAVEIHKTITWGGMRHSQW